MQLFEQYYLSDDPADVGNFVNGKLDFTEGDDGDEESEDENSDPGRLEHKADSNTSLNSMDDDLKSSKTKKSSKTGGNKGSSTIRLHERAKKYVTEKCDDASSCCVVC